MNSDTTIKEFILENTLGTTLGICNYGASITKCIIANEYGQQTDVVLGFKNLNDYKNNPCFLGVTIGRYANRIANAVFELDGKSYNLQANNSHNSLHGGNKGFHHQCWKVESASKNKIMLSYASKDMEEGFPGNLVVNVQFEVSDENEVIINYSATTDKTTVINLTNHAYFNLNGEGSGTCTNHYLQINANHITPIDNTGIPNGTLMRVFNTPFDFTASKTISSDIATENEQLIFGSGYDHNFVLNNYDGSLQLAATAVGDSSGIKLDVLTTEPGLQLYTGNFLNDTAIGKCGKAHTPKSGFCLETQHFADSPNQKQFPTTILKPGNKFFSTTIYKLSI